MTLRRAFNRLRQAFVLTPQEKAACWCIVGAFVLGVGTQQYRARHAPVQRENTNHVQSAKRTPARFQRTTPTPSAEDRDDDDD